MPVSVWTSTLKRTIHTANFLPYPKLRWKALDEIHAGARVCARARPGPARGVAAPRLIPWPPWPLQRADGPPARSLARPLPRPPARTHARHAARRGALPALLAARSCRLGRPLSLLPSPTTCCDRHASGSPGRLLRRNDVQSDRRGAPGRLCGTQAGQAALQVRALFLPSLPPSHAHASQRRGGCWRDLWPAQEAKHMWASPGAAHPRLALSLPRHLCARS